MTERRALASLTAMCVSLLALAFVFAETGIPSWIPPAPLVRLGIPSPLTGMTRSFVGVASGDLTRAFAWHPLGPPVFAACVAMPFVAIASFVRGRRFFRPGEMTSRALWFGAALLFVVVWARQIATLG